jgi:hypothetical protein
MSSVPIVALDVMGGLGNQIFQLATAYAYAKRNNGRLAVRRLKREPDGRPLYWDSILKGFTGYLVEDHPNNLEEWVESGATEFTEISPLHYPGKYLKGYLQSPKYFQDCTADIKRFLEPSEDMLKLIQSKYGPLLNNKDRVVVVHARRTDYLRNQDIINFHGPLSIDYYKQALKEIATKVNNPVFLLASDDPLFWKDIINTCDEIQLNNIYILDGENEINTMVLLQQFKYFIIANSTFSWWCAWLSDNPKYVIAPSKWFGPTGPKHYEDIYMESWQRI